MNFFFFFEIQNSKYFLKFDVISSSRGHSPCRSPLLCPSPDSTEGRTTPKFYISKLCTANTNSSSSHSSSLSAAPSPNSSSAMEMPMDIPTLCSKAANSDLNSDLDCSDVDCDSDSQNKLPTAQDVDEKTAATLKRDEACEKLKKLFFSRVSSDSTEMECGTEFKAETPNSETVLQLTDIKPNSSMQCDSLKEADNFCMVQNFVSSTVDIDVVKERCTLEVSHDAVDVITTKCVPTDDCHSVSVATDVVVVGGSNITVETNSTEHST